MVVARARHAACPTRSRVAFAAARIARHHGRIAPGQAIMHGGLRAAPGSDWRSAGRAPPEGACRRGGCSRCSGFPRARRHPLTPSPRGACPIPS
jgi:hypothetical protein